MRRVVTRPLKFNRALSFFTKLPNFSKQTMQTPACRTSIEIIKFNFALLYFILKKADILFLVICFNLLTEGGTWKSLILPREMTSVYNTAYLAVIKQNSQFHFLSFWYGRLRRPITNININRTLKLLSVLFDTNMKASNWSWSWSFSVNCPCC